MFLETFFIKKQTIDNFVLKESKDIIYVPNNKEFKKICNENLKLCVLALLDGRPNKISITEFDKYIETMEDVASIKTSNMIEYGWVNATCQIGFTTSFNLRVESLPGVVVVLPKIKKFAVMYSSFEKVNILSFIDNLYLGKVPVQDFDNDKIYLRNAINCLEVREEEIFNSDVEDDRVVLDLIAESKKKREEFELNRAKALGIDKKREPLREKKEKSEKIDL